LNSTLIIESLDTCQAGMSAGQIEDNVRSLFADVKSVKKGKKDGFVSKVFLESQESIHIPVALAELGLIET
jgi:hypothetical protein